MNTSLAGLGLALEKFIPGFASLVGKEGKAFRT
jgi:hypothetical protein